MYHYSEFNDGNKPCYSSDMLLTQVKIEFIIELCTESQQSSLIAVRKSVKTNQEENDMMNQLYPTHYKHRTITVLFAFFMILSVLLSLVSCGHSDTINEDGRPMPDNISGNVTDNKPDENLDPSSQYLEYLPLPDGTWAVSAGKAKLLDKIVIPATYRGKGVTKIADKAFCGCTGLTEITIPATVTGIGYCAFSGCTVLTSMTIPDGVTSIAEGAFSGCTGLTSVTIPDSVTSIGREAFSGCKGLTFVTIGNSVTSIGDWTFFGCTGLTSVTIGNSVTRIDRSAFRACGNLEKVYFEDTQGWGIDVSDPAAMARYFRGNSLEDLSKTTE